MHRVSHRRVIAAGTGKALKHARYALWKNPEDLTTNQAVKLAWIAKTDHRLYRAYLLKEGLRLVFQLRGEEAKHALEQWLNWARRCQIPVFVKLASRVQAVRESIEATLDHGLSNGLIESTNTKIRLLTRIAFGFKSPQALIALAMLSLGGYRPALPGRATHG
jgi:transposase